ncbi:TetR/AcrR family transcriptional regulator [Allonocardiopsis opalescens]|uniref:TetR family transcriptional regulator n=1 Tax=Allonocardiopsis opalescens TaxID=1144618 RepID=A0A2T0Q7E9_9ACTN|nr:TetR/AcrR family transcriptional regulator [Allonocardiopsis opalescens]PRX99747.1 TetR family transcriptional regulator [Allonocardiopsis opalescens]
MLSRERPSLTERRAEELRLEIARKAVEIFVADGDTSATVERIAEAAGISSRTFYRHFAVKEDVVRPLFRLSSRHVIAALADAPRDGDLVETLVGAWTSDLHDGALTPFERRFLKLMVTTPQYRLRWMEVDDELCAAMAEFLRERIPLGGHPLHRTLPAYLLVQATRHVFDHWVSADSAEDITDLLRDGFRVVLAGVEATYRAPAAEGT